MVNPEKLTESLKSEASRLGFDLFGACPAVTPTGYSRLERWLDSGYSGEMDYISDRRPAYRHPKNVFNGAVSVLVLGLNYQTAEPVEPGIGQGRLSRYCWSEVDYHDLIHKKLKQLIKFCDEQYPGTISARGVVDTAPLLEREFAQLAGLGWHAKNTMLINREIGSWFFLASLLINQPLVYDQPLETSHCGTCTACLEACPTDAFVEPGMMDASKCISYLTIELRKPIPIELRAKVGDWLFGCDVCQDVCPWNNKAIPANSADFEPHSNGNPMELLDLFNLDDDQFRIRFRKTPLWRPKRRGILRNAAIVLGNRPNDENVPALAYGLNDDEELVRGAVAWALGKHSAELARPLLLARKKIERIADVNLEIAMALDALN